MKHLPNILTLLRIVIIPLIIVVYVTASKDNAHLVVVSLFILASITDFFDGYLARKLQVQSAFGAFLDPVADKLLVTTMLILIVDAHQHIVITLCTIVIILREVAVSAMREWMAANGKSEVLAVSMVGKLKTTMQFIAIIVLFIQVDILGISSLQIGSITLGIATALTLYSGVQYARLFFHNI